MRYGRAMDEIEKAGGPGPPDCGWCARRAKLGRMDADKGSIEKLVEELARELDVSLIDAQLRRSPTERLEHMLRALRFAEDLRRARACRSEDAD